MSAETPASALRASAGMLSGLAAFPLLCCLIALLISSLVGHLQSIYKSSIAGRISGLSIGTVLFNNSSNAPSICLFVTLPQLELLHSYP